MSLQINDVAPDFEANTTQGRIRFHDWIGDSWAVLFSHPKDFTPVCTTELGYMARIKHEFDRRNTKIIGLSVDALQDHSRWANDIARSQGTAPNYPIIGDPDLAVAKLYNMLPASVSGDAAERSAADNQTVRNVFVVGPHKRIKLILVYPMTTECSRLRSRRFRAIAVTEAFQQDDSRRMSALLPLHGAASSTYIMSPLLLFRSS